jgi:hypothetical protein
MNPIEQPEVYKFGVIVYSTFSLFMFALIFIKLKVNDSDSED